MALKEVDGDYQLEPRSATKDELFEAALCQLFISTANALSSAARYIPNLERFKPRSEKAKRELVAASALILAPVVVFGSVYLDQVFKGKQSILSSTEVSEGQRDPARINFLEEYLRRPGVNGELGFIKQMEAEGATVSLTRIFGSINSAAAGVEDSKIRSMPHPDTDRFGVVSAVKSGDCFGFFEEQVVVKHPDGRARIYVVNPEGFVHAFELSSAGKVIWSIDIISPKCQPQHPSLPDGSRIYDQAQTVLGPSTLEANLHRS